MAILAGEIVTAARLNRMQPSPYEASITGTLVGPQTDADVPAATITLNTIAANAVWVATGVFDFDWTATTSTLCQGKLNVDSVVQTLQALAQITGSGVNDRHTTSQHWSGTFAAAGSHTLKLIATIPTNVTVGGHTRLHVTVYEVV